MATVAISGAQILLRVPAYSPAARQIVGARWIPAARAWVMPASAASAQAILSKFKIDQGSAQLRHLVHELATGTSDRMPPEVGVDPGGAAPTPPLSSAIRTTPAPLAPPAAIDQTCNGPGASGACTTAAAAGIQYLVSTPTAQPSAGALRGRPLVAEAADAMARLDLRPATPAKVTPLLPPPSGLRVTPWSHQIEGYTFGMEALGRHNAVLLAAQMGVGKTLVATMLALGRDAKSVLVVCPLRVVPNWAREIEEYLDGPKVIAALDRRETRRRAQQAADAAALAKASGRRLWVIVNYDSFWRDQMVAFIAARQWDMMIYDECLPPGILIATPNGDVPIETLKTGDVVYGFDHEDGQLVETTVAHTFCNPQRGQLTDLTFLRATPNHPIWTVRGYVDAAHIHADDEVLELDTNGHLAMRLVRDIVFARKTAETEVLRQVMLGKVETSDVWPGSTDGARTASDAPVYAYQQGTSGFPGEPDCVSSLGPQSASRPRSDGERYGSGAAEHQLHSSERRKWPGTDEATETPSFGARLADGGGSCNRAGSAEAGTATVLQDRHSEPRSQSCDRSRWEFPRTSVDSSRRHEKGAVLDGGRMDGASICQQANPEGPSAGHSQHPGSLVYNIETGTGNYFANGILAHNCHRLKAAGGKASMFAKRLRQRAKDVVLATGTPLAHSPLDIYGQFRAAAPSIFGTSYAAFKQRYAKMGGPDKKWVVGYQGIDDLERRMAPITWRCTKREALPDLPEEMDVEYSTEFDEDGARVYADMERDLISEIEGGQLTAQNALTKVLRLQQICGGAVPTDDGLYHMVDRSKYKLLVDVLEDLGPQPLIIFAQFRSDIAFCHEACAAVGLTSLEVSGQRDELRAWQEGKADVLVAQNQSGSVGINGTRAHTAIYYSLATSLVLYDQGRARIHRATQKHKCLHIYLTIRRTMDQKILKGLRNRQDVMESIMSSVAARAFEPYQKEKA